MVSHAERLAVDKDATFTGLQTPETSPFQLLSGLFYSAD